MSSPIPEKRRRLDNAATTLAKPFVSPIRGAKTPFKQKRIAANMPYTPSTLAHTSFCMDSPTEKNIEVLDEAVGAPKVAYIRSTQSPNPCFTPRRFMKVSPREQALQRTISAMDVRIRSIKNDLDALRQAASLQTSSTDADLEALTEKWRLASQSAAEELFGTVKERVCRMGGVVAWRESEKKKSQRFSAFDDQNAAQEAEGDDADCEFDSQGEELPEEEQELRKVEKRRMRKEMMEAADPPERVEREVVEREERIWDEAGRDDDTFTMDMMLRSLNIELDVIGYDKDAQRWIT